MAISSAGEGGTRIARDTWRCREREERMVAQVKDVESDDGTPWAGFAERKRIAAEMKASGETIQRIAEALKVNRTTVWRWSQEEGFKEYVSYLGTERYGRNRVLMEEALATSLQTICAAAGEGDAKVALGYVRTLLSYQAATS